MKKPYTSNMQPLIYADTGINWFFPFEVIYEDDYILILKELPRCHKYEADRGASFHVDKWVDLETRTKHPFARVGGEIKLVEIQELR